MTKSLTYVEVDIPAFDNSAQITSQTKFLLHFDTQGSPDIFIDSSPNPKTFTAFGNTRNDTSTYKFGGSSGLFDGTGDYITTPDHADFTLGDSDWTLDFWFNCTVASGASAGLIGQANASGALDSGTSICIRRHTTDKLRCVIQTADSTHNFQDTHNSYTNATNTGWHHLAWVRFGTTLMLFEDGVLTHSESGFFAGSTSVADSSSSWSIGRQGDDTSINPWTGWIDEARLTVGRALWINDFSVPSAAASESVETETIRYALPASYRPNTIDAIPSLRDVKIDPAIISLGQDLGQRATVTASLRDHKHIFHGESFESGTYWGKFRARYGLKLRGAPFRVIRGTLGEDLDDMETRHFIIEATDGPSNKGEYKIIAKDVIKLADGDRSQAPLPSNGFLNADVTNVATSITLSPSGISSEYPSGSPTHFYINVGGKEVMLVNFTSGDTFNVTRAQFNTEAVAHTAQDRVQLCLQYDGEDVADIIYDLLTTYADVDASYISLPTWQTETDTFLNQVYTALITEPTGVSTLVSELIEQAGLAVWWDEVDQLIKLQVLRPISTGLDTYDDDDIILDSLKVTEQPDKRISQVITYFAQINPLVKLDETDNFRSTAVTTDDEAETEYGSRVIKKIYSRWIPSGGRTIAENLNSILLSRFRDPPRRLNFELMRHSVSDPLLGQGYQVGSWVFQDTYGTADFLPVQITRLNPRAEIFEIEAEEFSFNTGAASSPDNHVIIIDASQNDVNLRTMHDSIYGAATAGIVVFCYIQAGVIVGSSSTSTAAFNVGTWPGSVTINLIVEGRIQGKGGAGGAGGAAIIATAFAGAAGGTGGTALQTATAITLTYTNGEIWSGGGGGGGGGGFTDGVSPVGGAGGSGGAGTQGGAGGEGGFGSASSSGPGNPGTSEAGGAGVPSFAGDGGVGGGPGLVGAAGQASSAAGGSAGAAGVSIQGFSNVTVSGAAGDLRGSTAG